MDIEIKDTVKKDYYNLWIDGVAICTFERSELRHLIETIDNKI